MPSSKTLLAIIMLLILIFGGAYIQSIQLKQEIALNSLKEDKQDLVNENQMVKNELNKSLDGAKESEEKNIVLQTKNEYLEKTSNDLKTRNDSFFEELKNVKNEVNKNSKAIKEISNSNNILRNELETATAKNAELSAENSQLSEKIESTLDAKDVFVINGYELWTKTSFSLGLNSEKVVMNDSYYYYVSLEKLQKIIEKDKTNEQKYLPEKFDCDKFSATLKVDITKKYGLNAIAVVNGLLVNAETKEVIGAHSMNIVFSKIGENISFYIFEPQSDQLVLVSEPGGIVLQGMNFNGTESPIFQPYEIRW